MSEAGSYSHSLALNARIHRRKWERKTVESLNNKAGSCRIGAGSHSSSRTDPHKSETRDLHPDDAHSGEAAQWSMEE